MSGVRILMLGVLFSGGLFLGQGIMIEAKAWLAQGLIARAWDRALAEHHPVTPWPWSDTWPVARLGFPHRGISLMVLRGDQGASLAFGPGWTERTALPGRAGVSVISGHRDTHFRVLRDLQPGEILTIQTSEGQLLSYRVVETRVVDQSLGWQWPLERFGSGHPELLLVTCYPFDAQLPGGPLRYLVRAERVAPAETRVEPGTPMEPLHPTVRGGSSKMM
ncbi:MAG: class GN sortase [Candidatus Thiodiazotropha sp.]